MSNKYIDLNRLEFSITDLCSSSCRHCSVKKHEEQKIHIDKSWAVNTIKRASERYKLESIMTFGGEPLLFPETVFAIHKAALDAGVPVRQIITNGYWTKDMAKIEEIAFGLAESGVNKILISVDAFHQEYIPVEAVKKAAKALQKYSSINLKWSPCWVVSEKDHNQYNEVTNKILKELEELNINVGRGNVVSPEGAALENLKEYLPKKKNLLKSRCTDMPYTDPLDSIKSVSIESNGDVAVCRGFRIGNVANEDINAILDSYDPYKNPLMKIIIEKGMEGLLEISENKGIKVDTRNFYSICELCIFIRKRIDEKIS